MCLPQSTVRSAKAGTRPFCWPLNPQYLAQHESICWVSAMVNVSSLSVRLNQEWTMGADGFQRQPPRGLQVTVLFQHESLLLNPVKWSLSATLPYDLNALFCYLAVVRAMKCLQSCWTSHRNGWNLKLFFPRDSSASMLIPSCELIHGLRSGDNLSSSITSVFARVPDSTLPVQALI